MTEYTFEVRNYLICSSRTEGWQQAMDCNGCILTNVMGEKFIYSIGDGISSNSPLLDKCYFKNQKLTAVKSK